MVRILPCLLLSSSDAFQFLMFLGHFTIAATIITFATSPLCVCVSFSYFYKDTNHIGLWQNLVECYLILITFIKTLFSNKLIFLERVFRTSTPLFFLGGGGGRALVRIKLNQQDLIPLVLSQEALTPHWMLCIFMLYLDEGERRE